MAVEPGQVYQDNDPRMTGRKVKVVGPAGSAKRRRRVRGKVKEVLVPLWQVRCSINGRLSKIAEDQFGRTGRRGFSLVSGS